MLGKTTQFNVQDTLKTPWQQHNKTSHLTKVAEISRMYVKHIATPYILGVDGKSYGDGNKREIINELRAAIGGQMVVTWT